MTSRLTTIKDEYTRRVSGETYQYEAQYGSGEHAEWRAQIYSHGELKGSPSGTLIDNTMRGDALKQYIIAYIEGIIERGLGIEE